MSLRPRRSALYMPGSNNRAIEKARTLPADAVILDLEDSIAPEAKGDAREQVRAAIKAGGFGSREVVVRINGLDTEHWLADIDMVHDVRPDADPGAQGVAAGDAGEPRRPPDGPRHRPQDQGVGDDRDAAGDPQRARDRGGGAR